MEYLLIDLTSLCIYQYIIYVDMVTGLPSLFVRFLSKMKTTASYPINPRQVELIECDIRSIFC